MATPRKDLTNKRSGMLVALKSIGRLEGRKRHPTWLCKCDCGRDFYVRTNQFTMTKHCGCMKGQIQPQEWLSKPSNDPRAARMREDRKLNPEKYRRYELKKRFNLTPEQFEEILRLQGNCCDICKAKEPGGFGNWWHMDHDHACCPSRNKTCGKCIRGILCSNCNLALGNAQDNEEILLAMVQYLRDYRNRPQLEVA